MKKIYEINGQSQLNGTIKVQGSKNASLAIIVASLLCKDVVRLENVPKIKDVYELLNVLKNIDVNVSFKDNLLIVDSSNISYKPLLFSHIKKFRASYYFIGAFISLFKKVEIFLPGGCQIGNRPIDQHIKGLSSLNANITIEKDILKAESSEINGKEISLDIASVGATINIILASVFANNTTIIKNAAKEPEIVDLVNFLNSMGANIKGEGSSFIVINPVESLRKTSYRVMSDRIVAGTYLIYGAMLAKKLTLTNINTSHNYALINHLINLGVEMDIKKDSITIYKISNFDKANIKTDVYPLFPSDLQQIFSVFLFNGKNISLIEETLFENRFDFLKEIKKMDGKYFVFENKAIIIPSVLKPANLKCKDLRGAAALLLACMACNGTTTLENIEYLSRGYEDIVKVLSSVGVDIKEKLIYEA